MWTLVGKGSFYTVGMLFLFDLQTLSVWRAYLLGISLKFHHFLLGTLIKVGGKGRVKGK